MVDHEGQLLGEEPDVEGVHHRPHGRNGQVRLEMLLVVPAERADPVALAYPKPAEASAQPLDSLGDLAEGRSSHPGPVECRNLAAMMDCLAVTEDMRNREGKILHRALHGTSRGTGTMDSLREAKRESRRVAPVASGIGPGR